MSSSTVRVAGSTLLTEADMITAYAAEVHAESLEAWRRLSEERSPLIDAIHWRDQLDEEADL